MHAYALIKNGKPETAFELREYPTPVPAEGGVLIESEGFGLNFADVMARLGIYRDCPPLPAVIGYENVGKVKALGKGVSGLQEGDRVLAFTRFGGYADHVVTPAKGVVKIPGDWSVGMATAFATQYITAYYAACELVNLHEGDHVLVHAAAGGVGTALVQLLKMKGCVVFGTAGSEEKLHYLREQGVDYPINYREADYQEVIEQLGFGRKLAATFNPVGGNYVKKDFKLLNAGGRLVLYGASKMTDARGNFFKMIRLLFGFGFWSPVKFVSGSTSMLGVNLLRIADHNPEILGRCLDKVVTLAEEGLLNPTVGKEFPHTELAKAHAFLESRGSIGKIAVKW